MMEVGRAMAGAGHKNPIRDVVRLVKTYGGKAADWSKRTSSKYRAADGTTFQTHWYENVRTGQRVEFKTNL